MKDRRPFPDGFHPNWVFAIAVMGLGIGWGDWAIHHAPLKHYIYAGGWVLLCHVVQLGLDYRASQWWYEVITTPPYRWTVRQFLRQRWACYLSFLAAPFVGLALVGAFFLFFMLIYYPWQRSLYFRSIREFGPSRYWPM